MKIFLKWRHKYLWLFLFGILFAFFVNRFETTRNLLMQLADYGYAGVFLGGVFYIFTFTTATGLVVITELSESLNPVVIGIVGGAGAVVGDMLIFVFAKKELEKEIRTSLKRVGGKFLISLLETKPLKFLLPVIGAILIASPFPDEIGVSLMGIGKISTPKFFLLSFVLNSIGIFILASAGRAIG